MTKNLQKMHNCATSITKSFVQGRSFVQEGGVCLVGPRGVFIRKGLHLRFESLKHRCNYHFIYLVVLISFVLLSPDVGNQPLRRS